MKKFVLLFAFFLASFMLSFHANAENEISSKKITIEVKNIDRGDYKLDLLVPQDDSKYMELRENQHGSIKQSELYLYRNNDEMAYFVRNSDVKGKLTGVYASYDKKTTYEFTGTNLPSSFKVIMESKVNPKELFVSEEIIVTNNQSTIVVDFENGKVKEKNKNLLHSMKYFISVLLFVVAVKLLISFPLGFKFKKLVFLVSFVSQVALFFGAFYLSIGLSASLLFAFYAFYFVIIGAIEWFLYRALLEEDEEIKNLIIYIAISGIITFGFAASKLGPLF